MTTQLDASLESFFKLRNAVSQIEGLIIQLLSRTWSTMSPVQSTMGDSGGIKFTNCSSASSSNIAGYKGIPPHSQTFPFILRYNTLQHYEITHCPWDMTIIFYTTAFAQILTDKCHFYSLFTKISVIVKDVAQILPFFTEFPLTHQEIHLFPPVFIWFKLHLHDHSLSTYPGMLDTSWVGMLFSSV